LGPRFAHGRELTQFGKWPSSDVYVSHRAPLHLLLAFSPPLPFSDAFFLPRVRKWLTIFVDPVDPFFAPFSQVFFLFSETIPPALPVG